MSAFRQRRVDRRTAIQWVWAASVSVPFLKASVPGAAAALATIGPEGYGTDPDLQKVYAPGELWPLTFTVEQRRIATALCDSIIPEDAHSPSAAAVGVVDFIDEWISAPYPKQQEDRRVILAGLEWLDAEGGRRFSRSFILLETEQRASICDDICFAQKARPGFTAAADFFARYRNLTAGGFYTTPAGMKDLRYVGNVPLERFDGPPLEVLKAVGLV